MSRKFSVDDFIERVNITGISGTVRPVYVDNEKQIVIAYDRTKGVFFAMPFFHSLGATSKLSERGDAPIVCGDYYPLFVENIFENVPEVMEFFNRKLEEKYCDSGLSYLLKLKSQNEENADEKKES